MGSRSSSSTRLPTSLLSMKARQRRKRDDDNNIIFSHARFLLKLIEGNAKDEATGICFVHALATDVVHLNSLL
jgi:hypothetical protein